MRPNYLEVSWEKVYMRKDITEKCSQQQQMKENISNRILLRKRLNCDSTENKTSAR